MALRCSARLSENRTPSTGHTSRTRRGLSVLPFADVLRACGKGIILDRTSHTRIPIAGTGPLYRSIRPAQSSLPDLSEGCRCRAEIIGGYHGICSFTAGVAGRFRISSYLSSEDSPHNLPEFLPGDPVHVVFFWGIISFHNPHLLIQVF